MARRCLPRNNAVVQRKVLAFCLVGLVALACTSVAALSGSRPPFKGKIAFVRFSEGVGRPQLFVLPSGAIRAERLKLSLYAIDGPSWSPDGRSLIVVGGRNHPDEPRVTEEDDLYLVRADGKGLRRLTSDTAHESGVVWSADGKRIAYVRSSASTPNESSIVVRSLKGGKARRLTFGNVDLEPSWSPTGDGIVFLRIDTRLHRSGIWLVRPDGSGLRRILTSLANVTDPVWSPHGDRLVVSDGQRLLVVRADGSHQRTIARLSSDRTGGRPDAEPTWSPDGTTVAFVQARSGAEGRADLWAVSADGIGLVRLTRSPGFDLSPAWGP